MIVNIDLANVGRWAESNNVSYTTMADLSQKPQVIRLIRTAIEKLNASFPDGIRVKKFVNFYKDFDPAEAELTRTRKLRRSFMYERYDDVIEAIYLGQSQITVKLSIIYQDGRQATIDKVININCLD